MGALKPLRWKSWAAQGLAVLLILIGAPAQAQRVGLETHCDATSLFENGKVADINWQSTEGNTARLPVLSTCWLRLTRPLETAITGKLDNQILLFENSWGSNVALYAADGELLGSSTIQGARHRVVVERGWVVYQLSAASPRVLYAKVQAKHPFSSVRHRFEQRNGDRLVKFQQNNVRDVAIAWILLGAGLFASLFYVFQRNRQYALFSGFALAFALTMLSDRGELAPFGLTAGSPVLSLAYPASGLLLAWLAWSVGRFSLHAPWAARAVLGVVALYGSLVIWQIGMMAGIDGSVAAFEGYSEIVYNVAAFLQLLVFFF